MTTQTVGQNSNAQNTNLRKLWKITEKREKMKLIYGMLTENTGKALCDSGDIYGRHWERNQKMKLSDFNHQPTVEVDISTHNQNTDQIELSDIDYTISVYHYLMSSYIGLDELCDEFNNKFVPAKDWYCQHGYGFSEEAEKWLETQGAKFHSSFNTANGDDFLSQTLQGTPLEINSRHYVLLQLHQGCDIRGGYTDGRLFYLPEGYMPSQFVNGTIDGYAVNNWNDGVSLEFEDEAPKVITEKSEIKLHLSDI